LEQYGFQKNISTTQAILDIVTTAFYDNIQNNNYSGLMLLDLKKKLLILSLMKYY